MIFLNKQKRTVGYLLDNELIYTFTEEWIKHSSNLFGETVISKRNALLGARGCIGYGSQLRKIPFKFFFFQTKKKDYSVLKNYFNIIQDSTFKKKIVFQKINKLIPLIYKNVKSFNIESEENEDIITLDKKEENRIFIEKKEEEFFDEEKEEYLKFLEKKKFIISLDEDEEDEENLISLDEDEEDNIKVFEDKEEKEVIYPNLILPNSLKKKKRSYKILAKNFFYDFFDEDDWKKNI